MTKRIGELRMDDFTAFFRSLKLILRSRVSQPDEDRNSDPGAQAILHRDF